MPPVFTGLWIGVKLQMIFILPGIPGIGIPVP